MEYIVERLENYKVIKFIGNMDVHSVHKIEKSMMEEVKKESKVNLVMDLSKVDFVSSAGLRVLVATLKICQELGSNLTLCGLKPSVQKVFDIVDMNSMFQIKSNLDEIIQ